MPIYLPLTARPWREWRPLGVRAASTTPCKNQRYQKYRILKIFSWILGNHGFVRNGRSATTEKQYAQIIMYIRFIRVRMVKLFKPINIYARIPNVPLNHGTTLWRRFCTHSQTDRSTSSRAIALVQRTRRQVHIEALRISLWLRLVATDLDT